VLNDMSELEEQERRRSESRASIEAIVPALIHEIPNPLVGITPCVQLLRARGASGEFGPMFSRTARRDSGLLDEPLSRFRTISRGSQQAVQTVDVSDPLPNPLETLHTQMEALRIRLCQVGNVAHRPVLASESQLQQLSLNLCLNAIRRWNRVGSWPGACSICRRVGEGR
jgi:nitrogen-specific signal transduction histidine kinase